MKVKEKGITLTMLVIIITVLLILVGVTISITVDGGRIVEEANKASKNWNIAVEEEKNEIAKILEMVNNDPDGENGEGETQPIEYVITYNQNEGIIEGEPNPTSYTVETEEIRLTNPIKEGHLFIGWTGTGLSENSRDNIKVTIPKGSQGAREYTAHWLEEEKAIATIEQNGENIYYDAIQNAVDSIKTEGKITLLKDTAVETSISISSKQTIEFDTNGKEVTSSINNTILNAGTLDIIGLGTIKNTTNTKYAISNWGTLNANSGTIDGINGGILNRGTVNVDGATIVSNNIGIKNVVEEDENVGNINITSGKVSAINEGNEATYAVRLEEGTMNMTGGEVYAKSGKGTAYGIFAWNTVTTNEKNVTIEVAGGTIKGESGESWRMWNWLNRTRGNTFN